MTKNSIDPVTIVPDDAIMTPVEAKDAAVIAAVQAKDAAVIAAFE
jgi:hypothetical protein